LIVPLRWPSAARCSFWRSPCCWRIAFATEAWGCGAFAVGKCGAYGQAFDYPAEASARAAAMKRCKGECTALTMKRACAALAVDMANPAAPMVMP